MPYSAAAAISIPITLTVVANSSLTVSPSALRFTFSEGGIDPAAQMVSVGSSGSSLEVASSTSGGSWLSASPSAGATPETIVVSVNPASLTPGIYSGSVAVASGGASNSPQIISVTLNVSPAPAPSISLSATSLSFAYQAGGALPGSESVHISGSSPVAFTATTSSPWLALSPSANTTPATLNVSVSPAGLSPGNYSGSVSISAPGASNSPQSFVVVLAVSPPAPATPTVSVVDNAASFISGPIAPGEIVTIGGTNLGPTTPASLTLDQSGRVSTFLGGVQVLFNGIPAPLTYVSASQVNAIAPYEIAGSLNLSVVVKFQVLSSMAYPLALATNAPALFTLNSSGTGPAAIVNQDGSINSRTNPAPKGSYVSVYATGEGQTAPPGLTGSITSVSPVPPLTPQPLLPVSVMIGGQPATMSFFGEAPEAVAGLMQVNVQVPVDAASGDLPIVVSVGGNPSQSGTTVSVQ